MNGGGVVEEGTSTEGIGIVTLGSFELVAATGLTIFSASPAPILSNIAETWSSNASSAVEHTETHHSQSCYEPTN